DRPQEADRERLAAGVGQLAHGRLDARLVEGDERGPDAVDALGDPADAVARNDGVGLAGLVDAEDVLRRLAGDAAEAAHHQQRVLVAARGQQPDARAL